MRHQKPSAPTPKAKPAPRPKPRGEQALTLAVWQRIARAIRALGAPARRPA